MSRITNAASRDKEWTIPLHDIDHLLGKGYLDHDLGRILRFEGGVVIDGGLGELSATSEEKEW